MKLKEKKAVCARVREKESKNLWFDYQVLCIFMMQSYYWSQTNIIQKESNLKFLFYRRKIKNIGIIGIENVLNAALKYEIQQFWVLN